MKISAIQFLAGPIVLEGESVRLEPLSLRHLEALCAVGLDAALWQWIPKPVLTEKAMRAYIEAALAGQERGDMKPFAIIERESGRAIGSTRYGAINVADRRLEIGWSWIARPWQRTAVNTEMKLLMLSYAFGTMACNRVEFKTDRLNERSRRAILRLGAQQEGTLRSHIVTASGRIRDTVYFSITKDEWISVKAGLEKKLARYASYHHAQPD